MSMELIAIISVGVTTIGVCATIIGVILNGQRVQQKNMDKLREEMQSEFKAVRAELQAHQSETQGEFKAVRAELQAHQSGTQGEFKAVRSEMQSEFKAVHAEIQAHRSETQAEFKAVREDINKSQVDVAYLQGLIEGLSETITGRRAPVAEAVAEDPGQYEP